MAVAHFKWNDPMVYCLLCVHHSSLDRATAMSQVVTLRLAWLPRRRQATPNLISVSHSMLSKVLLAVYIM